MAHSGPIQQRIRVGSIFSIITWFLITFLCLPALRAQLITNCENSNFNLGNFDNWNGCYGHFSIPCEVEGFLLVPEPPAFMRPLHKLIQGPGWLDDNTCDTLINVFPGEGYIARIGDTSYSNGTGKESEMSYRVTVSNSNYLFVYRYAVVLQNGGHPPDMQPDFQVMITDTLGNVIDSTCGYYYICAPPTGTVWPGWHSCITNISWKDWTTVGMDLTSYYGEAIYIKFKVRGCWYNTHFGYAYISAYCGYLELQTALCEGDTSATLTAPPGFSYEWNTVNGDTSINGDTTQSIVVPNPVTGSTYTCELTAINGCQVTITTVLTYTVIHTNFTFGSACADLPTQFNDSSWVSQNSVINWKWNFGDGTAIVTGVQNPTHVFDSSGTYNVTLISYSTEGCSDTIIKQVVVDSLPDLTNDTLRKSICSRAATDITLTSSVTGTLFTWTADPGSTNVTGYTNNTTPVILLNDTLVNTGPAIDSVMYTIIPHNGDCDGFDTLYTVLVYPLPVLTNSTLVKSICDSTETNIILESNNDTTRFTWTCTASSGNISGYSNNTTTPDTVIDQLLRNTGYGVDTVYYHIVPKSYGCLGDTVIYKVAVYPVPDLSNSPAAQTQCSGLATNITLTSHVAGTLFTWVAIPSSGAVTGWSSNLTMPTTTLNQVLVNTGTTPQTVTYRLIPVANSCPGDTTNYVVTVYPVPNLSNTPLSQSQCNNANTNLTLTSQISGTLFTWTATGSSPSISGYSNSSVPGTVINQTLVNSGYTIETVTYTIIPHANN